MADVLRGERWERHNDECPAKIVSEPTGKTCNTLKLEDHRVVLAFAPSLLFYQLRQQRSSAETDEVEAKSIPGM